MSIPTAVSINTFTGTVNLNDPQQEAWFGFTTGPGQNGSILMVRDPSPSGALTQADIAAVWQFYKNIGLVSGSTRTVAGHVGYAPAGAQPLLFVVRG